MKYIYSLIITFCLSFNLYAQSGTVKVAGVVMDESGEALIGVNVVVKGTTKGVLTDLDGRFRIDDVPAGGIIVYSYIGYQTVEISYTSNQEKERIGLKPKIDELDEVVVTGRGSQRKISVVGAITTVDAKVLQIPSTSVSNMLGGRVPGIISVSRSGEPGNDFSEFWVRGISTFGAKQGALVLIDGIEGNLNDLDPADIESFSILKDASSTAVYGTRGANGVVVVTTKRGKAGKLQLNYKGNVTYSYSPRMPEYLDSYGYANLANEARVVRGNSPLYTPTELDLYQTGLDPDLYPNVNWRDVILRDHVWNTQHHVSLSGGGENARYYISLGVQTNEAVFKQDKDSPYSANVDYNKYNFRSNIDANVTKTTTLSLNVETTFVTHNSPGYGDNNDALWQAQANLPPTIVPVRFSNGQLPAYGEAEGVEISPYVLLNYTGYRAQERYSAKTTLQLRQDLGMLVKGLSAQAIFSLKTNGTHLVHHYLNPDLWWANPKEGRYADGTLRTQRRVDKTDLTSWQGSMSDREYYFEMQANYERIFNEDHRVTALLHYYQQEIKNSTWGNGIFDVVPIRYQAYSGRTTYSFKDTYLAEFNLGYTGSENFNKENRFGWFPSVGIGWIPTQYDIVREKVPFLDYLKFRGSWGQVGNDRLSENDRPIRFPFLNTVKNTEGGIWGGAGITEDQVGAVNMQWETTTKIDLGIDGKLFNNKLDFTVDFYRNKTTGIFQRRASVPAESGLMENLPFANIGEMSAWGIDGHLSYTQAFSKDMSFTLRGNFTLARNKVDYWEQAGVNYPYQSWAGVPFGVHRGLIAEGLFKDELEIQSSPKQTFMEKVMPGDIKYKDVNGDGVINDDDIVPLSYSNIPQIQYGIAIEFNYKRFRINALLERVKEVEYFLGGAGYYPFAGGATGNVLNIVADQSNRWTPASYSGNPATENPNARFPRLTYGWNDNNNRSSTFWLTDGSFFRLKNVEVSYALPESWVRKTGFIQSATISLFGENLHVWDKVKLWDPGQASSNGGVYPLQRKYTLQLFVTF